MNCTYNFVFSRKGLSVIHKQSPTTFISFLVCNSYLFFYLVQKEFCSELKLPGKYEATKLRVTACKLSDAVCGAQAVKLLTKFLKKTMHSNAFYKHD